MDQPSVDAYTLYQQSKPHVNGSVESFNGKQRDELLNCEQFLLKGA